MTVVDLVLQLGLGVAFSAWAVRRDMRRLPRERLLRAWNDASFWSAIVAFGPLCLPFHFARTRRSVRGAALGFFWMALVLVATSLIGEAVSFLGSAIGI